MTLLILGLLIFVGIHLVPSFQGIRTSLIGKFGENKYKLIFTVISLSGLILLIVGKIQADDIPVWDPPVWGRSAAPVLMLLAFYCLLSKDMPSNLKRFTRHPMLWGVTLWAAAHLLTNGDLSSIVLFGGFALFSLFGMWSANMRGEKKSGVKYPIIKDVIVLGIGVAVFGVLLFLHPYLFGVAIINI